MEKLKVLIPTDFSLQAEFAGQMAGKLSEWADVELHYIHVIHLPSHISLSKDGSFISDGEMDVRDFNKYKHSAENHLQLLKENNPGVETHIAYGGMKATVVKFAKQHHFDLILIGTKGVYGLREKLTGSETQHIVRRSEVPVMSLMCDRSDVAIRNVLFVHDFSSNEKHNIGILKLILTATKAKLHLLFVARKESDQQIEEVKVRMKKFAEIFGHSDFEIHIHKDRNLVHGVTHFNQMKEMDMVCIGTHGRKGINQVVYSSPVEKLVNHLFKPILTYHLES